jgi:Tfp pilus assembly protein FimT
MELLVVVAMIGVILLVTMPALMQIMPQYRIRSAASEAAANISMVRQRAISTRMPWRIAMDIGGNKYHYYVLTSLGADMSVSTNWRAMKRDAMTGDQLGEEWVRPPSVDLRTTTTPFHDVVCPTDGTVDIIFLRDGMVSDKENCGGSPTTGLLDFTTDPSVVFAVDNNLIKYNRYYIAVSKNGKVTVTPTKE